MDTSLDPIARCVGHDPARESDRTPLGAVPAGTSVEMALNVLGDARTRVHRVELEVAGAAWVARLVSAMCYFKPPSLLMPFPLLKSPGHHPLLILQEFLYFFFFFFMEIKSP